MDKEPIDPKFGNGDVSTTMRKEGTTDSTLQQGVIPDTLERLPRELMSDPYGVLAKLRESPAVPIESKGVRYWVVTRYEDVRRVLSEPTTTIVRDLVTNRHEVNAHCVVRDDARRARIPHEANRSWLYQDGKKHHKIREVVARYFTPGNLKNLARVTDEIVEELVDKFRPGQQIDLIADYARPISVRIFCEMVGIPSNEQNMQALLNTAAFMSSDKNRIEPSAQALVAWATELVEIKRREPTDDLFSSLLRLQEETSMTNDELTSNFIVLAVGSTHNPVNAIGSGAFLFLTHPNQLAKALAEPSLFDTSVDEIVRYESSFRFLPPRYTTAPLELDGVTIPAGELLLVSVGGANRDPNFIADADVFDITRMTTEHFGFGYGVHRCLGEQLARKQTATALRTFFERFPATKLVEPPEKARWHPGKFLRKLEALPVIPA